MDALFKYIPAAASGPLALSAFAISAIVLVLVGARLKSTGMWLKHIKSVPPRDRKAILQRVLGMEAPPRATFAQWMLYSWQRIVFALLGATLILITTVLAVAPTQKAAITPAVADASATLRVLTTARKDIQLAEENYGAPSASRYKEGTHTTKRTVLTDTANLNDAARRSLSTAYPYLDLDLRAELTEDERTLNSAEKKVRAIAIDEDEAAARRVAYLEFLDRSSTFHSDLKTKLDEQIRRLNR